ncbi:lish domain-containing [Lasius niger]|uniref:Lish domain-containing n=1 Tax=Lasius niger TaxID=67767 RepID=A0A0J7K475_LASNI|nr:lish domain-containing [Lasius niger]
MTIKENTRKKRIKNKQILDSEDDEVPPKKSKKRISQPNVWKKNKAKVLCNAGKEYTNRFATVVGAKSVRPPCGEKCRLQCSTKIVTEIRSAIFDKYWGLQSLTRQRDFISKSIVQVEPSYRYQIPGITRSLNHAFYFEIDRHRIRVCKYFFKATLDINDRPIRTVISKIENGFTKEDLRGCHGNHRRLDESIKDGVRKHIDSIPRIESHYLRTQTTREFIEGGKTIADLHRDYTEKCNAEGLPTAKLSMFARIFNTEYNLSFFTLKKDQCELCTAFGNAQNEDKEALRLKYETYQRDKQFSRVEKNQDKKKAKTTKTMKVATYDLQAVLPLPRGDVSVFYYKSKLNAYNFTICQLNSQVVECYT